MHTHHPQRVGVIGGGIGGLAAAITLLKRGHSVTVFEKNQTLGGKAQEHREAGYRFDTGPSLLTLTETLEALLAPTPLTAVLELERLEPLCRYLFPDGKVLDSSSSLPRFTAAVAEHFPEDAKHLGRYLQYSKRIYDLSAELFLFRPLHEWRTVLSRAGLKTLFRILALDPLRSMHRANSSFFRAPEMIQLFNRYATYNGSNPFQAPATLNVIPYVEYGLGGYYVKGGIYRIVQVLEAAVRKLGGEVRCGAEVQSIVTSNNRVTGVVVGGETVPLAAVVSNSDVQWTFERLLTRPRKTTLEPSSSAVVFLWGVKRDNPALTHHNILFSAHYEREFDELFHEKVHATDPTVYVNISSKSDSTDAPPGCENWFVLVNAPAGGDSSAEGIRTVRKRVFAALARAKVPVTEEEIECERVITPRTLERDFFSPYGSIYGTSSNSRSAAFLRQRNRCQEVKGLYFAGGSAHPGGGIPLVVLSGTIAGELLDEDLR
jgi:phytoene desaturase